MQITRLLTQVGVFGLVLGASVSVAQAAATLYVDDSDTGSDAVTCGTKSNPCQTIQRAVDLAVSGDTIRVAAGTYNELVTVNKTLTLRGAQYNRKGTRNVPLAQESVVGTPTGAFQISANSVTLDGFLIRGVNGSAQGSLGAGIHTTGNFSGHRIENNIIRDNTMGLYLNSNGTISSSVRNNWFENNNVPGSAAGNGIYSDQGLSNAIIQDNNFRGHTNGSILLTSTGQQLSNVRVQRNTIRNDAPIVLINVVASRIHDNDIDNPAGSGIFVGGGVIGTSIEGNDIRNGDFQGIALRQTFSAVQNANNRIYNNRISGFGENGITIDGATNTQITNNRLTNNGQNGIQLENGTTNSEVRNNRSTSNAFDGIRVTSNSTNNTLRNNRATSNVQFDARDFSVGSGTAGTANTWISNNCNTGSPANICE